MNERKKEDFERIKEKECNKYLKVDRKNDKDKKKQI